MLTFDMLLKSEGLEPSRVALARHQRRQPERNGTPFSLWQRKPEAFAIYQSLQGQPRFRDADFVAAFVVTPTSECLFVGLFKILGIASPSLPIEDPLSGETTPHEHAYDMALDTKLTEYIGKLTIEWGQGYIAWVQKGGSGKRIQEIRLNSYEQAFPGFLHFRCKLSEMIDLPQSWKERLLKTRGIYILTSMTDMRHYVGSATGAEGFYGRWTTHLKASGDAVAFRNIPASDYQLAILQVASGLESDDDVIGTEHAWMNKLQSRSMGLNGVPATAVEPEPLL